MNGREIEIDKILRHTERGIQVKLHHPFPGVSFWLPVSQVKFVTRDHRSDDRRIAVIPAWLFAKVQKYSTSAPCDPPC